MPRFCTQGKGDWFKDYSGRKGTFSTATDSSTPRPTTATFKERQEDLTQDELFNYGCWIIEIEKDKNNT